MYPVSKDAIMTTDYIQQDQKVLLDKLAAEIADAQRRYDASQIEVLALTDKVSTFQMQVAAAEANRVTALNNKNLFMQLLQSADDLNTITANGCLQVAAAASTSEQLASEATDVVNKLIYSAELVNKLSDLIVRQKALNPLMSDDLVSRVAMACTDANNAVALSLTALQSCFAAQAATAQTSSISEAGQQRSAALCTLLSESAKSGLNAAIRGAYDAAIARYETDRKSNETANTEFTLAQAKLSKAQTELKSLQAGLAAANAAVGL